jgi:uncharacterized protein (UPF0333 family)
MLNAFISFLIALSMVFFVQTASLAGGGTGGTSATGNAAKNAATAQQANSTTQTNNRRSAGGKGHQDWGNNTQKPPSAQEPTRVQNPGQGSPGVMNSLSSGR